MQLFSAGLFYIGGSVLLALLGMWLVRRFAPYEVMEGHKEIAGFIYGVLGTIYAVILGFSVVVLWEQFMMPRSSLTGKPPNSPTFIVWPKAFPRTSRLPSAYPWKNTASW
ncbi:MAG: hypothetical protein QOF24_1363 [Verrucomicrobiota bacterium]|jgi:hypothetical protein